MLIRSFLKIIIDSLFPISNADKLLFSYTKEQALQELPKAPQTPFPNTYSVFAYKNELVTRLVWNIKYKKNMQAVGIGGYGLYERIKNNQLSMIPSSLKLPTPPRLRRTSRRASNNPSYALCSATSFEGQAITNKQILLVPIPMTRKRKNERGFNQCELLVDEIIKLDKTGQLITYKDLLIRTVHQDRQTLKDRRSRLEDAKGVFSINENVFTSNDNTSVKNIPIIIIDDVITTGSTMKEAMETLTSAGFRQVIGISLAH